MIAERFESDAAFERAAGLLPKTVSNWRRGRSSSYLKHLPELSELLGVRPSDLLASEESWDAAEAELVSAWRGTSALPPDKRRALADVLISVITLYTEGAKE